MYNQLKIERFKLKRSIFFYFAAVLLAVGGFMSGYLKWGADYSGIDAYMESVYDTSLMFVIAVFVLMFLVGDFSSRTIQNEIKMGYSRFSVLLSRGLITLPAAGMLHFFLPLSTAIGVGIRYGWASEFTLFQIISRTLIVFLQVMTINSFLLLIIFICKKVITAFATGICFVIITCNILRGYEVGVFPKIFDGSCFYLLNSNDTGEMILAILSATVTLSAVFAAG